MRVVVEETEWISFGRFCLRSRVTVVSDREVASAESVGRERIAKRSKMRRASELCGIAIVLGLQVAAREATPDCA